MLLRRLRAALDLDAMAPESRPAAPSRLALLRRVRSAVDLDPVTPESRRASARMIPLLGPLVLVAARDGKPLAQTLAVMPPRPSPNSVEL